MSEQDKKPLNNAPEESNELKTAAITEDSALSRYGKVAIMGLLILVMVLLFLFTGHSKAAKPKHSSSIKVDDTATLQADLNRLKQVDKQFVVPIPSGQGYVTKSDTGDGLSKEQLARMSAPSTVYESANGAPKENSQNSQGGVFAGHGAFSQFGNQATTTSTISATKIKHPRYTIASGEFIHGVLETAINSDIPGMVRAVITRPVYAYIGETPLIPAGSRLIGQYSSAVLMTQSRVMIVWNRIILPSGIAIQVNSPGADELGVAGQGADSIDHHFLASFGKATLLSLIGAGVQNLGVNSGDQFNSASNYRMAMGQAFQQSADSSLNSGGYNKPTLHIYQGAKINVFVAHDLDFYDVLGPKA